MRKSLKLKDKRNEKITAAEGILNSVTDEKPLNDDQRQTLATLKAEIEVLNQDIATAEFYEAQAADTTADVLASADRNPAKKQATADTPNQQGNSPVQIVRSSKLRFFNGPTAEKDAYASGMWILAALYGRQSAREWCRANGLQIQAAANEGVNSQGGFLVPSVLENMIIDLRESYGVFRQNARIHPMGSDHVMIPRRTGGLTAYAVGEAAAITDSTKGWDQVSLTAKKWAVLAKYSSEIAEDAIINIAEDLGQEVAYAFAVSEDTAGFVGDGSATYNGIQGIDAKFEAVIGAGQLAGAVDAASGHDTFAEIDANDLTLLTSKLPKYAVMNAKWYCSQPCWSLVFQRLQAAAGGNSVMDVAGKMQYSYLGYPIVISQSLPTSTGDLSDKVMLLFGDMRSAVTMGTRRGVSLAVSDQAYFANDQLAVRGTERFDINVHDIGDTTNAGPLVALIGE